MTDEEMDRIDQNRRHFLTVATAVTGLAGAAAVAVPFLSSLKPSARAQALGEELAAQPRQAVASMLQAIVGFETRSLEESIADEQAAAAASRGSADAQEGMRAFLEKRKPVFNQG